MSSLMPTELIRSKIVELAEQQELHADVLAERAGVGADTVHKLFYSPRPQIEFDVVDRLFCALRQMGRGWGFEELLEAYDSIDLSGPSLYHPSKPRKIRCRKPGCSKMFVPNKHHKRGKKAQVYCSSSCKYSHWRSRRGLQNRRSEQMDFRCRNGHLRTPENTKIRPNGTRLCRTCLRLSDIDRRARNREAVAA